MSQQGGMCRLTHVSVSLKVQGCHRGLRELERKSQTMELSGKLVRTGRRDRPWMLCAGLWPASQVHREDSVCGVVQRIWDELNMSVPDPVALTVASFHLPPGNEDQELETLLCIGGWRLGPSRCTLGN